MWKNNTNFLHSGPYIDLPAYHPTRQHPTHQTCSPAYLPTFPLTSLYIFYNTIIYHNIPKNYLARLFNILVGGLYMVFVPFVYFCIFRCAVNRHRGNV